MPVDYGIDLDWTDDATEEYRTVTGSLLVAQAIMRRYRTARGMLIDDANYGTDLTEYLEEDVDQSTLDNMSSDIIAEPKKDERVKNVTVQELSFDQTSWLVTAVIGVELQDRTTFTLTIAVSKVTVDLLQVQ